MGKTAKIMTKLLALQIRNTLDAIFSMNGANYRHVAIKPLYPDTNNKEWGVYMYANTCHSSFLADMATLAKGLESCSSDLACRIDEYDAGTTEPDIRTAVLLY